MFGNRVTHAKHLRPNYREAATPFVAGFIVRAEPSTQCDVEETSKKRRRNVAHILMDHPEISFSRTLSIKGSWFENPLTEDGVWPR